MLFNQLSSPVEFQKKDDKIFYQSILAFIISLSLKVLIQVGPNISSPNDGPYKTRCILMRRRRTRVGNIPWLKQDSFYAMSPFNHTLPYANTTSSVNSLKARVCQMFMYTRNQDLHLALLPSALLCVGIW